LIAVALAVVIALPAAAIAAPPQKKDQNLVKVLSELENGYYATYAQEIIEYLCGLGDSDIGLGFRGAGGPADIAAAEWIAEEMLRIGLEPVKEPAGPVAVSDFLEEVPVDSWEFNEAYVEMPDGRRMTAASFGGFPPTDGPITKEIIWLNNGYKSDYDAYLAEDPEYSFEDKIGLINWIGYAYWTDSIAVEAMVHGLAGIVLTTIHCNVGQGEDALSCHDGLALPVDEYPDFPPLISISVDDGYCLRNSIWNSEDPFVVTMYSDIVINRIDKDLSDGNQGGCGYNVVGYLPGKYWGDSDDEYLIIGPHHDAWFYGAMDDTSAVAAMLVLAEAFQKALGPGKLDRTLVFTSHTGEEYGILDTYYDWCYGANWQIVNEHPEWVGKSVAYLCLELMGMAGEPVYMNCPPEMYSLVKQVLSKNAANMPYGSSVDGRAHTWADHWTFTAAGVPGIEFETVSDEWETMYYHSNLDAPEIIDYGYMSQLFAVLADFTVRLASWSYVPYNFQTYAKQLNSALNGGSRFDVGSVPNIYSEYGIDMGANFEPLLEQLELFNENVGDLSSALSSLGGGLDHDVNSALMSIAGTLDRSMTAMGVWEQDWFPYQQPINDVYHLYNAIQVLTSGEIDEDTVPDAVLELSWVGIIWYYAYDSYENYMDQYERLTGDRKASWGLQNHLQPAIEIWAEYDALMNMLDDEEVTWDELAPIVEDLEVHLLEAIGQLEHGFNLMWTSMEDANGQIDALVDSI